MTADGSDVAAGDAAGDPAAGDDRRTATDDVDGVAVAGVALDRARLATAALALSAAAVAVLVGVEVFPYRSLNHDEGVYLQQAAMLLDGRLFLRPPVPDAFRPWFFVEHERGLYPKYAPVPAAAFALGRVLGGYPVALAGVAAAVVALTVGIGRELYDARTGLLAGAFLLASPLFLVQSGVYLPYATTTALNLAFALAYLRADRLRSRRLAAAAGVAIGLAVFARPYTALLFAAPFVGHAVWTLGSARAWHGVTAADAAARDLLVRRLLTAALGALGVAVALGYNLVTTGDPLVFPYQAFAPADGVGFGHRRILGHEVDYTLSLALRSNARVLRRLFTDWVVAGSVGTALAGVGVAGLARSWWRADDSRARRATVRRALLAGLFVSVPLGNVAFWGNLNLLGALDVATDGLVYYLGPYYHYDLLVPTAVFAAAGALALRTRLRSLAERRVGGDAGRRLAAAVVLVSAAAVGGAAATTAADPLERNRAASEELAKGYEPFVDGEPPTDAVVFLPRIYGPWLNHPFQRLRNDPGYDGERVYALGGVDDLRVAAAFPDRALYRYVHAGTWAPADGRGVDGELRRFDRVAGERARLTATLGVPERARAVTVRVAAANDSAVFDVNGTSEALDLALTVEGGRLAVAGDALGAADGRTVSLDGRDEVRVAVFVRTGASSSFSYRLSFPVAVEDGTVRTLTPTREWCRVPTRCLPAGMGDPGDGVFVETELRAVGGNGTD